ncbi:hypothetical protein BMWSH_2516 [Priestia megaterium WSH-002]|uniref:Uncharacterized protein n=1 Tax=Priestia megaterium (strain WSH-002) TaxID=1006007 RepID=A0A8D3WZ94_PRIMW|nr:hypothetical protein BMWSH_2516 [Priestia megaterium WSH-002]
MNIRCNEKAGIFTIPAFFAYTFARSLNHKRLVKSVKGYQI